MLKIRMQRVGKRGQAYFRLVVTEHTTRPQGKYLELLGSYNPHKKALALKEERLNHWLKNGVQMSATANNLLVAKGMIQGQKVKAWKAKKKKKGATEGEVETKPRSDMQPETTPAVEVASS